MTRYATSIYAPYRPAPMHDSATSTPSRHGILAALNDQRDEVRAEDTRERGAVGFARQRREQAEYIRYDQSRYGRPSSVWNFRPSQVSSM